MNGKLTTADLAEIANRDGSPDLQTYGKALKLLSLVGPESSDETYRSFLAAAQAAWDALSPQQQGKFVSSCKEAEHEH